MEETIEKNNDLITNQKEEINNHPDIVKDLEAQIKILKNHLFYTSYFIVTFKLLNLPSQILRNYKIQKKTSLMNFLEADKKGE